MIYSPAKERNTVVTIYANYQGLTQLYYPEYFGKKWAIQIAHSCVHGWNIEESAALNKNLRIVFEEINPPETFGLQNILRHAIVHKVSYFESDGLTFKAVLDVEKLTDLVK